MGPPLIRAWSTPQTNARERGRPPSSGGLPRAVRRCSRTRPRRRLRHSGRRRDNRAHGLARHRTSASTWVSLVGAVREPIFWCVRERGPAGPGGTEAGWLVGRDSARRHRQTPTGRLSSPRSLSLTRTTERSARRYRAPRGGPSCLRWRARSRPAAGRWTGTALAGEWGNLRLNQQSRRTLGSCWLVAFWARRLGRKHLDFVWPQAGGGQTGPLGGDISNGRRPVSTL